MGRYAVSGYRYTYYRIIIAFYRREGLYVGIGLHFKREYYLPARLPTRTTSGISLVGRALEIDAVDGVATADADNNMDMPTMQIAKPDAATAAADRNSVTAATPGRLARG